MTRLKALELFGFKSFADRTRFEFPEGITVVVGPNGSGKSNVVDALKWVLGEQSVRSLRGKEMSDVIFAGSGSRKPLNYAEVSLVFDNTAGQLPVEAAEVQIARRVQRSGESEYLVNGETSRLRDVRELFSGTGAATQAYSVIEQGRVDALLVASGRDRRAVFEEAAGITRFRARRTEALRRLERTELNRQRLADIVGEVSARLETVRHQAARARRWRQMTDRLKALRLVAAREDLADVDAAVAAVEAALAAARAAATEVEARSTRAAAAAAALAAEAERIAPRAAGDRAAAAAAAQRAAAAEATLGLVRQRRDDVERDVAAAAADVATASTAARAAALAVTEAERAAESLAATARTLADRLAESERIARGSQDDAAGRRRRHAEAAAILDDRVRERLRLEAARDAAAARAGEVRDAADTARAGLDAARGEAARLAETHAACDGHLSVLADRLRQATHDVEAADTAQRRTAESLQAAWHELSGWQAKLEACRERSTVLAELVDRREGLSDAARRLLVTGGADVPGLAGTLADIVEASVEWAALVDLALGGLSQGLVVESLADTIAWQRDWSTTAEGREILEAGGRITFVAAANLPAVAAFDPGETPGVVGRLDRLVADTTTDAVTTPELARRLLEKLLGRFWVVERLEDALPLVPHAPAETVFLTRSGQSLAAAGTYETGAPAPATGLVARRSELRALAQRRSELEQAAAAAAERVARLEDELAELAAAVRQAQARRQEAVVTIASSRAELARVDRDRHAAAAAIGAAESGLQAARTRLADSEAAVQASAAALAAADGALEQARADVDRAAAEITALERDRGELVELMHGLRIEQATCGEKLARSHDTVAARAAALQARRTEAAAAVHRHRAAEDRLAAQELAILAAGSEHAEAVVALETTAAALVATEAAAADLETGRRNLVAALDEARAEAARLAEAVHTRELEAGDARHRRARIVERIRDEYDIDIEAEPEVASAPDGALPPVPGDRATLDREVEDLRRKLASMTTVNLEALAESEELATRLATLEAQLADITTAKQSITELISRIDDESRRQLGETIETVRGHFRDLFERLFGGGQADIVLEPDVDLLETAVEIVARPPGKEPRSISLLSGGEKTMTCVALLLAIFKSRPSPFCVLDEVDAALDEANVDRFAGVLRDFLSTTQFIVVTHSKKTMAAANTLYGVTMEESGVSKRVSVRFESTAAASRPTSRAA
jgi:chromosome segregation protein